jgi:hypothetical protein
MFPSDKYARDTASMLCKPLVALVVCVTSTAGTLESEVAKHLPRGAALAYMHTGPAAVIGSIEQAGTKDLAFIYQTGETLHLRVVSTGRPPADAPLDGSYVSRTNTFPDGISLIEFDSSGVRHLVTLTSNGASLGIYFNVFTYQDGKLVNVVHGQPIEAHDFTLARSADGSARLVIYGKWNDQRSARVEVYEWSGSEFVETDKDADVYFFKRLDQIAATGTSSSPTVISNRVYRANLIVPLYLNRHRYQTAVALCQRLLSILDNPANSLRRPPGEFTVNPEAEFESELRSGKARIHELLADSYQAAGQIAKADAERRKAALH